jgi:hypothetical protein
LSALVALPARKKFIQIYESKVSQLDLQRFIEPCKKRLLKKLSMCFAKKMVRRYTGFVQLGIITI